MAGVRMESARRALEQPNQPLHMPLKAKYTTAPKAGAKSDEAVAKATIFNIRTTPHSTRRRKS